MKSDLNSCAGSPGNGPAIIRLSHGSLLPYKAVPFADGNAARLESVVVGQGKSIQVLSSGAAVVIAGYGVIDVNRRSTEGLPRKAVSFVNSVLPGEKKILLGPHPGRGACPGDSGGSA